MDILNDILLDTLLY